jgi:hypothetical protein
LNVCFRKPKQTLFQLKKFRFAVYAPHQQIAQGVAYGKDMHQSTTRLMAIFILLASLALFSLSCEAQQAPDCAFPWIAPGQRTLTPAEVTGPPSEHLQLHGHHPKDTTTLHQDIPDDGYLITGDKVDLVTVCAGYAYVRFHGVKRLSTGWVEQSRIQAIGKPYVSLPPDVAKLCKAAEDTLNKDHGNGSLKQLPLSDLPNDVIDRLHIEGTPGGVAHVEVGERHFALASINTGGTCESSTSVALTDDLTARLSPSDIDDRNIRNTGQNLWSFGITETLVEVLGQPMILSTGTRNDTSFYLSAVDKYGDIVPACSGERVTLKPQIQTSTNDRVCEALLPDQLAHIPMSAPTAGEKLVLSKVDSDFTTPGNAPDSSTSLSFHDGARAADATYTLEKAGLVDIDNSGHPRRVGLVSLVEGGSSAGCGDYSENDISLVYIDDNGVADPAAPLNKPFESIGQGMSGASFVKYDGKTYIKLDPSVDDPIQVWLLDQGGLHETCTFQVRHYQISPISN